MQQTINGISYDFPDDSTEEERQQFANQDQQNLPAQIQQQSVPTSNFPLISALTPTHVGRDILGGTLNAAENIYNWIAPQSMQAHINFPQEMGVNNPSLGDILFQSAGKYLPAAAIPGEGIPYLAAQTLYGASQSPANRLAGAGIGLTSSFLPGLAERGINSVVQSNLSPEQLLQNVESSAGTTTPLGSVLASSPMQRLYENILPHIPLSGTSNLMQKTASQIADKGNDLYDKINENIVGDVTPQMLQTALKSASIEARANKKDIYNNVNNIANGLGLQVGRGNLQNAAQDELFKISQSPELARETDPSLLKDLRQYAANPIGNTLELSNIFKGKLGDKAQQYYSNGQMYEYGIMNNLKNAAKNDIASAIDNSGSDALKDEYTKAEQNYQQNFLPFEDPNIVKFTRKGGDPDTILPSFLKTNAPYGDRAVLLQKLQSKLEEKNPNLLASLYLKNSVNEDGQVNPLTFAKLYNNLSDNQKSILFSDNSLKKSMDSYSNLVGMNKAAFNTMHNPPTGQRLLDTLGLGEIWAGGHLGGVPGAIASLIGPAIGARGLNTLLTSPGIREAIVKSQINQQPLQLPYKNVLNPMLRYGPSTLYTLGQENK